MSGTDKSTVTTLLVCDLP